uniref:Uncharacterized protein n=1 Tax=Anopheles melas TaxID=34690 RepID=A0A182TL19_9DIPT
MSSSSSSSSTMIGISISSSVSVSVSIEEECSWSAALPPLPSPIRSAPPLSCCFRDAPSPPSLLPLLEWTSGLPCSLPESAVVAVVPAPPADAPARDATAAGAGAADATVVCHTIVSVFLLNSLPRANALSATDRVLNPIVSDGSALSSWCFVTSPNCLKWSSSESASSSTNPVIRMVVGRRSTLVEPGGATRPTGPPLRPPPPYAPFWPGAIVAAAVAAAAAAAGPSGVRNVRVSCAICSSSASSISLSCCSFVLCFGPWGPGPRAVFAFSSWWSCSISLRRLLIFTCSSSSDSFSWGRRGSLTSYLQQLALLLQVPVHQEDLPLVDALGELFLPLAKHFVLHTGHFVAAGATTLQRRARTGADVLVRVIATVCFRASRLLLLLLLRCEILVPVCQRVRVVLRLERFAASHDRAGLCRAGRTRRAQIVIDAVLVRVRPPQRVFRLCRRRDGRLITARRWRVPKHLNKPIVQHGLGTPVRDVRFRVRRKRHNCRLRIVIVPDLDVGNLPELRKVIVQVRYLVQPARNLAQLQRAVVLRVHHLHRAGAARAAPVSTARPRSVSVVHRHLALAATAHHHGPCVRDGDRILRLEPIAAMVGRHVAALVRVHHRHGDQFALQRRRTDRIARKATAALHREAGRHATELYTHTTRARSAAGSKSSAAKALGQRGSYTGRHATAASTHPRWSLLHVRVFVPQGGRIRTVLGRNWAPDLRNHGRIVQTFQHERIGPVIPGAGFAAHAVPFLVEVAAPLTLHRTSSTAQRDGCCSSSLTRRRIQHAIERSGGRGRYGCDRRYHPADGNDRHTARNTGRSNQRRHRIDYGRSIHHHSATGRCHRVTRHQSTTHRSGCCCCYRRLTDRRHRAGHLSTFGDGERLRECERILCKRLLPTPLPPPLLPPPPDDAAFVPAPDPAIVPLAFRPLLRRSLYPFRSYRRNESLPRSGDLLRYEDERLPPDFESLPLPPRLPPPAPPPRGRCCSSRERDRRVSRGRSNDRDRDRERLRDRFCVRRLRRVLLLLLLLSLPCGMEKKCVEQI